MIKRY